MESVREHMDHHDTPEELPLLTESAQVTDITALDHNRTNEARRAAATILTELEREEYVAEFDPPHIDWDGVTELLDDAGAEPYAKKLKHLKERYFRPYPSLLSIRLREEEEPLDFVPGQYVAIKFHDTPRPYSVASSPNRNYLEFCIRRVPEGRLTPDLFEHLDLGDEVTIRGPNGDFVMTDSSSRDIAFLATGTGVAPLKSMIQYMFEENQDVHDGSPRDVWLFLGCSWKDDLPYQEQFRQLANEHDNFHFVPTLSREAYLTDWDGETAYVQQTFMKYVIDEIDTKVDDRFSVFLDTEPKTDIEPRIDPSNLEVYACGVNAMVKRAVDAVRQIGVPEKHINSEGYG